MGNSIPLDTSVESEYSDGYIHSESTHNDISPYDETKNILNDIIEKRPEADHGKMVRFSLFYKNKRYDIDFTNLPDNARPIRFRHAEATMNVDGTGQTFNWLGVDFGYQMTVNGKSIKEIRKL